MFEEQRTKVWEIGCDDLIHKPFQTADILQILQKHLGIRYVYEESREVITKDQETADRPTWTQEDLEAIPVQLVKALEEAAESSDMDLIELTIDNIRFYNGSWADTLAHLSMEFKYDESLALFQTDIR